MKKASSYHPTFHQWFFHSHTRSTDPPQKGHLILKQGTPGSDSIDLSHFGHLQYPAGSRLFPEIDGDEIVVF